VNVRSKNDVPPRRKRGGSAVNQNRLLITSKGVVNASKRKKRESFIGHLIGSRGGGTKNRLEAMS